MQKEYIISTIVERFSTNTEKREEALREIIALSQQDLSNEAVSALAQSIPPLPHQLYEKWASLFAEKLLATVDPRQITELCVPTSENQSTLALLFAMFMESETMEKQKIADLERFPSPKRTQ